MAINVIIVQYKDGFISDIFSAGTFNMPTSYQWWVWERVANINWSTVTYQGSTRSELRRQYFQHAPFIPIVGVGKRSAY